VRPSRRKKLFQRAHEIISRSAQDVPIDFTTACQCCNLCVDAGLTHGVSSMMEKGRRMVSVTQPFRNSQK